MIEQEQLEEVVLIFAIEHQSPSAVGKCFQLRTLEPKVILIAVFVEQSAIKLRPFEIGGRKLDAARL